MVSKYSFTCATNSSCDFLSFTFQIKILIHSLQAYRVIPQQEQDVSHSDFLTFLERQKQFSYHYNWTYIGVSMFNRVFATNISILLIKLLVMVTFFLASNSLFA
jgi:hypothetical protein